MKKKTISNLEILLEDIAEAKCILLLGPEICVTDKGQPFEEALIENLDAEIKENKITYYKNEELFFFQDIRTKMLCLRKIKKLYEQGFECDIYKKIAEIPFHLIISITPDHTLYDSFKKVGIKPDFKFFNKNENPEEVEEPQKDKPLVYNLFGDIDEDESLILTHDDFFNYLLSILGDKRLPNNLKDSLQEARTYIFLGFKFDKWYVQLLLRILNLHEMIKRDISPLLHASNILINPDIKALCSQEFKIEFVDDNCKEFINILYENCEKRGWLRTPSYSDDSIIKTTPEKVDKCIEENNIEEALSLLKDFFEQKSDESISDEIILLTGRFSSLKDQKGKGTIKEDSAILEENKIRESLRDLNQKAKELE